MKIRLGWLVGSILLIFLSGCAGLIPPTTVVEQPSTTPSPIPSATIMWFPATATPTPSAPIQSIPPTPDMRPGLGTLLLADDFSNPSVWLTGESASGSVTVIQNGITLAVSQSRGSLFSLRNNFTAADFYMSIAVKISLCRGADAYGLLVRAGNSGNAYRFLINCSSQVRLERLVNSQGSLMLDWQLSGQVPAGAPLNLTLGVWASGKELRFFINDIYQFSAADPVFALGQVGVYAHSASDTPLTVSFSNLQVNSLLAGLQAPPTPIAIRTSQGSTPTPTKTTKPVSTSPFSVAPTLTPGKY